MYKEGFKDPDVVQPDLLIACDIDDTTPDDERYMGTPTLVVEIPSSSTRRNDMAYKLNSYMLGGVEEYWIVDPEAETVMVYTFNDFDIIEFKVYSLEQEVRSLVFDGLTVQASEIFKR
ncbi:MAG: Uma2 family endonuclease [Candidatus Wallacebacter cryptica]